MKSVFFLVILVFFFAIYFVISNCNYNNSVFTEKRENGKIIKVEKVNNSLSQIASFQIINNFETEKDTKNWFVRSDEKHGIVVTRSSQYVSEGKYSMEVKWGTDKWSELVFVHFPEEWEYYKNFGFDIYNSSNEELSFEFKVGDKFDSDGFYFKEKKFVVKSSLTPGLNKININVSEIAKKISIISEKKVIYLRFFKKNSLFYLDNMRLE